MEVEIESSWKEILKDEFSKEYFTGIVNYLKQEKASGQIIYPKGRHIFNAFNTTPFDNVKVVILGQDPYHGPGQAHGLSFSVQNGVPLPPSLHNIYKELSDDVGISPRKSGDLTHWAEQGVFLLNAVLTVSAGKAASHGNIGWTTFSDSVIKTISDHKKGVVFMLWGSFARSKKEFIDTSKHYILEAAHPSPLARGAFFGCRHFSRCNEILTSTGRKPIEW